MSGVNKVIIVGRCGKDPETKYLPSGNAVTNISVATSEKWKDKQTDQQQEKTEWHNLVFFNRLAEVAGEYLRKGSMVYIEGKLQTRKWQDQSGNDRYTTEIVANEMQMLGGKQDNQQQQAPAQQPHQQQAPQQMQQAPQQYQQAPPQQMQQQQAPMQQQQPYQQQAPQAGDFDDDIPF